MSEDKTKEAALSCAGSLALLALTPAFALYRGWALWILWGWFAPLAWGPLPWLNAVGVCLISSLLTAHAGAKDRGVMESFSLAICFPLLVLAVAGVLHFCGVRGV
jgi:hypothetical protein